MWKEVWEWIVLGFCESIQNVKFEWYEILN